MNYQIISVDGHKEDLKLLVTALQEGWMIHRVDPLGNILIYILKK